jgi:hypothetical protein
MTELPLEKQLETQANSRASDFPDTNLNYFNRYREVKQIIARDYYNSTAAGLSLSGERFTLHSIDHVDQVIRQAGHLIGLGTDVRDPAYEKLEPFELFVLLYAILLHDAGNARGREGHERAPRAILRGLGQMSGLDDVEQHLVASIAQAHGGTTATGGKDTITDIIKEPVSRIANRPVRGRRLAALVRFADELSEDSRRADPEAVRGDFRLFPEKASVPESVIHNMYCQLINTWIDYPGRSLSIGFRVHKQYLNLRYPILHEKRRNEIFLVDYIAQRMNKLEQERRYYNRFTADFIAYDRCRITLQIVDDEGEVDSIPANLEDFGYPILHYPIKTVEPRFDGALLQEQFFGAVQKEAS